MNKDEIYFFPKNENGNDYIKKTKDLINQAGFVIKDFSFKYNVNMKNVYLNWFENVYDRKFYKRFLKFLRRFFCLIKLKRKKVKIFFVLHNKIQHDKKGRLLSRILMKRLIKYSFRIVVLCDETKDVIKKISKKDYSKKIYKIPHINYAEFNNYVTKNESSSSVRKFLYFGEVRAYKNIELLIDAFSNSNNKNSELMIAGRPSSDNYKNYLIEYIKTKNNSNIKYCFKFLDNEELIRLISDSDVIVVPYDINSSLNSGSLFLSASLGKAVIMPKIGSILEIENDIKNVNFSYSYDNLKDHYEKLLFCINEVLEFSDDELKRRGKVMQEYVLKNNSNEIIIEKYKKLFL